MEFIITDSPMDMNVRAAALIEDYLRADPACVLGLATGTTPIGLYKKLVDDCAEGLVHFDQATTFNLDEYCGLDPRHQQSYRYFMNKHLFDHVDIDKSKTFVPEGINKDAHSVCASYEQAIQAAGGIDMQLLGLGSNGHIGFNEPAEAFPVTTHQVELSDTTIKDNSRLFDSIEDVPRRAYTMGIGTIMAARSVLVVAEGAHKAAIVKEAFFGPVTPQVPASILQFHPCVSIMVDPAAGAYCKEYLTNR